MLNLSVLKKRHALVGAACLFCLFDGEKETMYIRLSTRRTKAYYQEIMAQAMAETDHLRKMSPEVALYEVIYAQLMDLKEQVIDRGMVIPRSVLYKRYSLGTIAVKNFDEEHDPYAQRLCDCYGGALGKH